MAVAAPAPAPAIPASVQYWFNYRDQFLQADQQHGNILGLLAANNNTFPPFDAPLLPNPAAPNCRYNGPLLIADETNANPIHIRPHGVGVLVGLWAPQDATLPRGNAAWDPLEWCVVHGRAVRTLQRNGRSTTRAMYFVRRLNYLGDVNRNPPNLPRTRRIALRDVFRIHACAGLSDQDMLAYIHRAVARATAPPNNAGEARAQFAHMRLLQRAHLGTMPRTPWRDHQRRDFLLP